MPPEIESLPAGTQDRGLFDEVGSGESLFRVLVETVGLRQQSLPIPPLPKPPPPISRSRRCRQRFARALALWRVAEQSRCAVNFLYQPGSLCGQSAESAVSARIKSQDASDFVSDIWRRLLCEAQRVMAGRRESLHSCPTGDALLSRVMKREVCGLYLESKAAEQYVSFVSDLVVEPPVGHTTVPMLEALGPELADAYADIERMLRPAAEVEAARQTFHGRYCRVMGQRSQWVRYFQRPDVRALWRLRPADESLAVFSVAAVLKKDGRTQRKLVQSVPLNAMMRSPAELLGLEEVDYGLAGGVALCQLSTADGKLAVATLDESNAFTHVVTPSSWWPWMTGPLLFARELPADWRDPLWPPDLAIRPQYQRLGMGHSHAVFILQTINLRGMRQALVASSALSARHLRVRFLNAEEERRTRAQLTDGEVGVYAHLDDIAAMAAEQEDAALVVHLVGVVLRALGFVITFGDALLDRRYLGFSPRRSPARWEPYPEKLGHL